jgi:F0F1-type ATP synthase membrane subunit b/b'
MTRTNDPRTATHLEVADGLAQATRLLQQLADAENEFSRQLKEVNGQFPLEDDSLNK